MTTRAFSSSSRHSLLRALTYPAHGDPLKVLKATSFEPLPPPASNEVTLKILLSPINPADINTVEGVYPSKSAFRTDLRPVAGSSGDGVFVGGNEGVARVVKVGSAVNNVKPGDRVIFALSQSGTWATHQNAPAANLIPTGESISDVHAATMRVNPPTALGMLTSFVSLSPGEFVIQNGANSAVGQATIQVAKSMGLNTINLIRDRPDVDDLKAKLVSLGATHVLTYQELADKAMRSTVKEWTHGKPIRLGLNCVGGKETTIMAGYLGHNAHLVSYGAMSKSPLSLPTSLFIFKNLTAHGYWQSRWYEQRSRAEGESMLRQIISLIESGQLREPEHEIVTLTGNDDQVTGIVRRTLEGMSAGRHGKKVLLRWSDE